MLAVNWEGRVPVGWQLPMGYQGEVGVIDHMGSC